MKSNRHESHAHSEGPRRRLRSASLMLIAALSACSRSGPVSGVVAATVVSNNACARHLISEADVASLVNEAVTSVETLKGDTQSCVFNTSSFSTVTVSLRPGLGESTVHATLSGATNVNAKPLAGVGDQAAWTPVLNEVNASKKNVLCDISAIGPNASGASAEKLGALCNKIFTAY